MDISLKAPADVLQSLQLLTPGERDVCILHFVDGRSQTCIAQWLNIHLRLVQRHITNAVAKVPELNPLRIQSQLKPKRPRLFHLSQLRPTDRGSFNADQL